MLLDLIAQLTDGFIASIDHNHVVIGGRRLYTPCFKNILDDLEVSLLGKGVDRGKFPCIGFFLHILGNCKKGFLERGRKLLVHLIVVMEIFHNLIDLILNRGGYPRGLNVLGEVV